MIIAFRCRSINLCFCIVFFKNSLNLRFLSFRHLISRYIIKVHLYLFLLIFESFLLYNLDELEWNLCDLRDFCPYTTCFALLWLHSFFPHACSHFGTRQMLISSKYTQNNNCGPIIDQMANQFTWFPCARSMLQTHISVS